MSKLSPIALFVFNRPDHTENTLNALKENPEFAQSLLFVYCDGPRNAQDVPRVQAVREVVRAFAFSNVTLIEREHNLGLAKSIIIGVSELCNQFGRIIVLEDDLIVAKGFLSYMNRALQYYENEDQVMQISGYMFSVVGDRYSQAALLPITSTWGWATWKRAWSKLDLSLISNENFLADKFERRSFNLDNSYPYTKRLDKQRRGHSDSWGIQWYMSVFSVKGLVLYPPATLVINHGYDGSGTHCGVEQTIQEIVNAQEGNVIVFPKEILINEEVFRQVKKSLKQEYNLYRRGLVKIRNLFNRTLVPQNNVKKA